jgi:exodeoxyribonuclease VII small subunit
MTPRTPKKPRAATADGPAPLAEAPSPEVATLPFEEALTQLERIVEELEEGALPLEEALARFERGMHLSRHLEGQLRTAEARVQKLVGGEAGAPVLAPLEAPEEEEPGFAAAGADEGFAADDEEDEEPEDDDAGTDQLF